jgi:hypothetical protein
VQNSSQAVSLASHSLIGTLPHGMFVSDLSNTEGTPLAIAQSSQLSGTKELTESDLQKPIFDFAAGSQVHNKYEGHAPRYSSRAHHMAEESDYLRHFWIGKKFRREMLILTLSRSPSKCSDSDLSSLSDPERCLTDNPINSFLGLVSAHRQDSECLSTFFYTKLSLILRESLSEAEREAELDYLCRWIPRGDLKKNYFAPINIKNYHWTFVHADLECSKGKKNQGRKASPALIYYDSYRGNLEGCLDDFEVFFHHLARKRNRPDLGVAWEKKNGKAPIQHDVTHCGLFVCAGIDCISSGISPAGYGTSTMPAFRADMHSILKEAGHGGL